MRSFGGNRSRLALTVTAMSILVAACSSIPERPGSVAQAVAEGRVTLETLPRPSQEIVAAVYGFPDLTGQFRQTQAGHSPYARAITQGGASVLIGALLSAGGGDWFRVVERNRLDDVLTERQIIREQRRGAVDEQGNPLPPPPPLLYAGVIFTGGIIGYDTNTLTGGAGARFLGIGGNTEYRHDVVTVYLRAVNSRTGEIWHNVVASERIYSVLVRADAFRFIDVDELLEAEIGFTRNEPRLVALREAVESALLTMIAEGAKLDLWSFANQEQAARVLEHYASGNTRALAQGSAGERPSWQPR